MFWQGGVSLGRSRAILMIVATAETEKPTDTEKPTNTGMPTFEALRGKYKSYLEYQLP
jgi:hypothetical protein